MRSDLSLNSYFAQLPPVVGHFMFLSGGLLDYSNTVLCVFFPLILDIKFVGRTSRGHTGGGSHRISHPPSFCGARLNFSREKDQPFLSLVDCEVEFCVL